MDIGLDEIFLRIVIFEKALVLFHIEGGPVGEILGAACHSKGMAMGYRGAGDLVEPVCFCPVKGCGCSRDIIVNCVFELLGIHRNGT